MKARFIGILTMAFCLFLMMVSTGGVGWAADPIEMAWMNVGISGGKVAAAGGTTTFCTGAATCTATNPGECDLLCEDFEGSTDCDGAGGGTDAVCRNGFAVTVGTGATVDFTSTATGTYPCASTTNTNVLKVTHGGTATKSYASKDLGADKAITYSQVYFRVNSEGLANTGTVSLLMGCADSGCSSILWEAFLYDTLGTISIRLNVLNSSPAWVELIGPNISTGTWYRMVVKVDKTNGKADLLINGTSTPGEQTLTYWARENRYHHIGLSNQSVANTEVEFDNWTIDDDSAPGACLN